MNFDNISDFVKWYAVDTVAAVKADLAISKYFGGDAIPTEEYLREVAERSREVIHVDDNDVEYIYRKLATEIPHRIDLGTPIKF